MQYQKKKKKTCDTEIEEEKKKKTCDTKIEKEKKENTYDVDIVHRQFPRRT